MAFVVLAEQFMSTAQKEIYKKLSQYQRKFYIEYLADEYIAEFCEEFGIA